MARYRRSTTRPGESEARAWPDSVVRRKREAVRDSIASRQAWTCWRGRALMVRGQWDQAEAAFDEVVRARPYNASSWHGRGGFYMARGQPERAAADFETAIRRLPEALQLRYFRVLSLLAQGDKAGLRRACSELLDRFDASTNFLTANNVAWYCVVAPDALADREAPVRLAELAVNGASEAEKPVYLNTLGAARLPRRAVPGSH